MDCCPRACLYQCAYEEILRSVTSWLAGWYKVAEKPLPVRFDVDEEGFCWSDVSWLAG